MQIEQASANNLLDEADAETLRKADEAQREALKVDDFDPAELMKQSLTYIAKESA
ncbi:MAG: hypothetical protein P8Y28_15060 [Gammaproteobacteria bacterium]